MFLYIHRLLGLDSHVIGTLILRGWTLGAGILTMLLVVDYLPSEHQGFFFTFSSLIALQIFFELGLNHVILQIVSHELALFNVASSNDSKIHASRLISVQKMASKLYSWIAITFAVITFSGGAAFFNFQQDVKQQEWLIPWGLVCLSTAFSLYMSPLLVIAEGAGRVDRVARLRLKQSMTGYLLMWIILLMGGKLWSTVAVPCISAVFSWLWLSDRRRLGMPESLENLANNTHQHFTWRQNILPLQWRISLSWISGYVVFQLFTPFLFAYQGAEAAGRAGLALAGYTAILNISMSWINASAPQMSAAIARRDRMAVKSIFLRILPRSISVTAIASIMLVTIVIFSRNEGLRFADRIADVETLIYMGITTFANAAINGMAIFMRCHKEEPMLMVSLFMATVMLGSVAFASRIDAVLPFMLQSVFTTCLALPWTIFIFRRYWLIES